MSALDPAQLAARFRRVWTSTPAAANAAPDNASAQASTPAPTEQPWSTAEAYGAPVTGPGPGLYSNMPGPAPAAADRGPSAPGPPGSPGVAEGDGAPGEAPSRRRPMRRRWLPPASPAEREAPAVDPPPAGPYWCPHCGRKHQGVPMGGGGAAAAYGRPFLPEPGQRRPVPLGHGPGDTSSLRRAAFRPWSTSPAAEPVPPGTTLRERIAALWYGDQTDP